MVGAILVGIAIFALILLALFAYWKPGPGQKQGLPPEPREGGA